MTRFPPTLAATVACTACAAALTVSAAAPPAPARRHPPAPVTAPVWPPGTEFVPFELRDGLILVQASLRSPSGSDAAGLLVFDTGAPGLVVDRGVWDALRLDILHPEGNVLMRRRPLDQLEMGTLRMTHLMIDGVIGRELPGPGVIGLFGPSLLGERAIAIDYERRSLAIVDRSLTLMSADPAGVPAGVDRARWNRVLRSRARFGAILPAASVPVPLRLYPGGRLLVEAQVEDPAASWRSRPLALLLDTGASACVIFEDAIAERAPRVSGMVRYHDVPMETVLGSSRIDMAVLPRLRLLGADRDLAADDVEAGRAARSDLPDLEGELPDPVHGLLGYSFLRRYRPVIDYADEVLWLEPRTTPRPGRAGDVVATTAARGDVGIVPSQTEGRLCVGTVVRDSPAARAGVQPGEAIVSIDGRRSAEFDPESAARLLAGVPGTSIVVIVRRSGMERVLRLTRVARR